MSARSVLCRVGLHRDRRERLRTGEWVYRCRRCDRLQGRHPVFALMGPGARSGGGLYITAAVPVRHRSTTGQSLVGLAGSSRADRSLARSAPPNPCPPERSVARLIAMVLDDRVRQGYGRAGSSTEMRPL